MALRACNGSEARCCLWRTAKVHAHVPCRGEVCLRNQMQLAVNLRMLECSVEQAVVQVPYTSRALHRAVDGNRLVVATCKNIMTSVSLIPGLRSAPKLYRGSMPPAQCLFGGESSKECSPPSENRSRSLQVGRRLPYLSSPWHPLSQCPVKTPATRVCLQHESLSIAPVYPWPYTTASASETAAVGLVLRDAR